MAGFTPVITVLLLHLLINIHFFTLYFDVFSSNVDVISSNLFVSGELNAHRTDLLTHSMGTDRHGELLNNLKDLTQLVYFRTWSPDSGFDSAIPLNLFLPSDHSFCYSAAFFIGEF